MNYELFTVYLGDVLSMTLHVMLISDVSVT
jgi:hypothetical protein